MVAADAVCYRHPDRNAAVGCQRCDRPICTQCMHSASVGFHCSECVKGSGQRVYRAADVLNRPPQLTYALIGINVAVFVIQFVVGSGSALQGRVFQEGVLFGPLVADGEFWRLVTGGFLHSGLLHIAFNSYALYIFGPTLERGIGSLRMGLIYAGGLMGGSLAVMAFNFGTPTLGASGAVLGLAGGLAAVLAARGQSIMQTSLGGIFLINLALPLLVPRISFWGHFGGIAGGFIVGAALAYLPARLGQSEQTANLVAGAVAVVLGVAAVGVAYAGGLV